MESVNLIYYDNGVGLTKDAQILETCLKDKFEIIKTNASLNKSSNADINIFVQNLDRNTVIHLNKNKVNILIPNLEWMTTYCLDNIKKFDFILTKSEECKKILDQHHEHVIYTGFTSIDRYNPTIEKTRKFLHFSGKSIQKYTELVVDVFNELNIPITIVDNTKRFTDKINSNITYIPYFVSEEESIKLFNSHNFHICISLAEGWGHYIHEAMSCKNVVIINDCSPENELITNDEIFLTKTSDPTTKTIMPLWFHLEPKYPFRKLNYTDKVDFINNIKKVTSLSDEQLTTIGNKARKKYLLIDFNFKNIIDHIFDPLFS